LANARLAFDTSKVITNEELDSEYVHVRTYIACQFNQRPRFYKSYLSTVWECFAAFITHLLLRTIKLASILLTSLPPVYSLHLLLLSFTNEACKLVFVKKAIATVVSFKTISIKSIDLRFIEFFIFTYTARNLMLISSS